MILKQSAINGAPTVHAELVGATWNVLEKIEAHASSSSNEVCGFLYKTHYVPLPNTACSPTHFYADPRFLARTLSLYGEPEIIFHSHPNGNLELSQTDRALWYYTNSTIMIGCMREGRLRWKLYGKRSD